MCFAILVGFDVFSFFAGLSKMYLMTLCTLKYGKFIDFGLQSISTHCKLVRRQPNVNLSSRYKI
jgi:hypothetical protein